MRKGVLAVVAGVAGVAIAIAHAAVGADLASAQTQTIGATSGPPPVSRTGTYSPYELQSIREVEAALGARVDPQAEGKIIEKVEVITLDVIEPRDPAPGFLNKFHMTTRPYVIAREVLIKEGEVFRRVLADETARNLRGLPQLSLVICVALEGSAPDRVRLVVITKDVWSLRLSWDLALGPGGIERLLVQPGETNILGTQQSVALRFSYLPAAYSLGGKYVVPRLFGTRISTLADANVIINKQSGSPEGSFGSVGIGQPLYSTLTKWAWNVSGSWRNEMSRRYVNAQVATFDAKTTPDVDRIPYQYRSDLMAAGASVTRSFGWAIKNDFSVGFDVSRRVFRVPDLSAFDPAAVQAFVGTRVPVNDTRVGPYAQYHAYTTDFMRVLDFETLGLQEDFRLGHELYLRAYPVNEALGSTRSFVGVFAAAQYTVPLGDGLARAAVEWLTETQSDYLADASISAGTRIVSPRTPVGRLVFDGAMVHRYRNYLNGTTFLGGDSRLRGYPTAFFDGKDYLAYNLEFRSRPVEIFACQLGGAVFYDAGDAFDGWENRRMHHSAGFGFRVLFPQLDRIVFRGDLGFPIEPHGLPARVSPVSFFVGFDQAFSVPRVSP